MNLETRNLSESQPATIPETMQAIAIDSYGDSSELKLRELPTPQPDPDQVLIQVQAAGVNPVDWKMCEGQLRWIVPQHFPTVLGYDVSGSIAACGTQAAEAGWQVGDLVCAFLDQRRGGAYAPFAVAGADVVVRKPANLTHEEAAAIPLAAMTAWQSLVDVGNLQPGSQVLVNGASGGVGSFAVQIAQALGAEVTGVCSDDNVELVRELGAETVIDYKQQDFTQGDHRYDIVLDAVAKSSYRECRKVLRPHGSFITTLPSWQSFFYGALLKFSSRTCHVILARPNGHQLSEIMKLAEQGKLKAVVDQVIPLEHAGQAHRISKQGHVRGKLVLAI